ncbi:transporter [Thermoleophilia bacterium SCSIO 60948]|nr:transporter [Thermoleophilia bacterium SCSIO 60948]
MIWVALAVVLATSAGIAAQRRAPKRAGEGSRAALNFALFFVLPPCNFLNLEGAELDLDAFAGIACGWASLIVLGLIAWAIGLRLGLPRATVGALILATVIVNTGYFGLPVVAALFGFDAISEAAAYDVLVSNLLFVTIGAGIGAAFGDSAGASGAERVRSFLIRNPTLYAVAAAFIVPASVIPEVAIEIARIVVVGVLPLGFFAVGVVLSEAAADGAALPPRFDRPVAIAVGLRLVVGPLLLLAIAVPLADIPPTFPLLAAMPAGLNAMLIANAYGLDQRLAAGTILWSTALVLPALLVASLVV